NGTPASQVVGQLAQPFFPPGDEHEVHPALGEASGEGFPDARGSPRDQRPGPEAFNEVRHGCVPSACCYEGKHLPKAISNFGDPLMWIFLRSSAHSRLRSFARKPSHVSLSALTRRSASP